MSHKPVVVITGCSQGGIGHATACAFAARGGCTVYATARRPEAVGTVPPGVQVLRLEVTDTASVAAAVATVVEREGGIDVLINNAGIGCIGPLAEVSMAAARQTYEVNVLGTLAMVQAVVPHMAAQGSGKIINVGSIVGLVASPWHGVYSSSKAAVHNLTDALRLELAPFGIQVMLLAPGAVQSNIGNNIMQRLDMSCIKVFSQYAYGIEARAMASQTSSSTPTDVFAREVMERVMRARVPRQFIYGHMASLFKFVAMLPGWVRDWIMARRFGLLTPAAKYVKVD